MGEGHDEGKLMHLGFSEDELLDNYFETDGTKIEHGGHASEDDGFVEGANAWDFPSTQSNDGLKDNNDELLRWLGEADRIPFFASTIVSLLGCLIIVLTIGKTHRTSYACVDELLRALSKVDFTSSKFATMHREACNLVAQDPWVGIHGNLCLFEGGLFIPRCISKPQPMPNVLNTSFL